MRVHLVAAILVLMSFGPAFSHAASVTGQDSWSDLLDRTERAYARGDHDTLRLLRDDLTKLLDADLTNRERSILRYTVAYLAWRLLALSGTELSAGPSLTDRDALLHDAAALLRADVAENPANAESHALLAGVYGLQVETELDGMTFGMQALRASARAVELEPDNPRVLLLDAVGKLHTPRPFGGGDEKAEIQIRKAVTLFRSQYPDPPWPRWGLIDAYAWLGQIVARRGDSTAAKVYYRRALDLEPRFTWILDVLMPALD